MMRRLGLLGLLLVLLFGAAPTSRADEAPGYPGAIPGQICYRLDDDLGELWKAWIENAVAKWNAANKAANTGWTIVPCCPDATPDITFGFQATAPGGAQGGRESGTKQKGYYRILIQKNVKGKRIQDKVAGDGVDGTGWSMEGDALDPVLVMEHEISHALGVDGDRGKPDSGNVENPIDAGNHGNPTNRMPSEADTDAVKEAIKFTNEKYEERRAAAAAKAAGAKKGESAETSPLQETKSEITGPACPEPKTAPQPPPPPSPSSSHGVCLPASPNSARASGFDAAVLAEINHARTDPQGYARTLKGPDAAESVAFLESQPPRPTFTESAGLDAAARREAADQGPIGGASHTGRDGSTPMSRIAAECVIAMVGGEEISLHQKTAAAVVRQLIIDNSSAHHFHRADLFSSAFTLAGAACGPNAAWGEMCVVDLAAIPAEY